MILLLGTFCLLLSARCLLHFARWPLLFSRWLLSFAYCLLLFASFPRYFLLFACYYLLFQKQPSRGVLRKRCSENMQQIYRRTPMPKYDFNKVAKQLYWKRTSTWVFSCKFAAYFQNTFSQEHLWRAASALSSLLFALDRHFSLVICYFLLFTCYVSLVTCLSFFYIFHFSKLMTTVFSPFLFLEIKDCVPG